MSEHAQRSADLLLALGDDISAMSPEVRAAAAQAHATLALVEAVTDWQPPSERPEEIPAEETPEGWRW